MSEGKKYDTEKVKVELLYKDLVTELEGVARVLTFGASKYDARNWVNLENGHERYNAAAIRHINARMKGEIKDPESGETHLSHAICCLLFMQHLDTKGLADVTPIVNLESIEDIRRERLQIFEASRMLDDKGRAF